jgi:hypothetical protein
MNISARPQYAVVAAALRSLRVAEREAAAQELPPRRVDDVLDLVEVERLRRDQRRRTAVIS